MALPGILPNAWHSFGGQGTPPHLSSLQSAHQLSVWNPVPNSTTTNLHAVHNTTHVHTSSPVQQLESPAGRDSQSPETPAAAKGPAPEAERESLTPNLVTETPTSSMGSFTAGTGLPTMNGTPVPFPSPSLLKKPKRTRRKRCLECEGCRRKDNCGVCSVCTNPNATNTVCKKRRCELLKTRPSAAPAVSYLHVLYSVRFLIIADKCPHKSFLSVHTRAGSLWWHFTPHPFMSSDTCNIMECFCIPPRVILLVGF